MFTHADDIREKSNRFQEGVTTLAQLISRIEAELNLSAITGAKNVDVMTYKHGLTDHERKTVGYMLKLSGYRFEWHNVGDSDTEHIHIMWD